MDITTEQLELLLTEWGALAKYEEARADGPTDFHALQRAREFAPGTKERAALRLVGRDGGDRRRHMARELGDCGKRIVPKDYVDPVSGTATRKATPSERVGDSIPPRLRALHGAIVELYRMDILLGLVIRQEYGAYGSQHRKAERVTEALGGKKIVGVRVYREALARAKGWVHGRLVSKAA